VLAEDSDERLETHPPYSTLKPPSVGAAHKL
jgi:hypothetical protein